MDIPAFRTLDEHLLIKIEVFAITVIIQLVEVV
jgi:hypothetical protein